MKNINQVSEGIDRINTIAMYPSDFKNPLSEIFEITEKIMPISLAIEKVVETAIELTDLTCGDLGDLTDLEKFFDALIKLKLNVKELQSLLEDK